MDSIPLEMDEIFEDYDDEDSVPMRLPDLEEDLEPMRELAGDEEEGRDDELQTDNAELLAKLKSMKGASKHTTKKTMPKLDAARLTGERGIAVLPKVFKDVSLKGKNHEVEDLKLIMRHLEHWAHRLFPKMPFAEVLERAERLGAKKEVQSCVKRIRLDMPLLQSEVTEEEDNVQRTGEITEQEVNEDEIEELLREESLITNSTRQHLEMDDRQSSPVASPDEPIGPKNSTLTEEMKARIERNKQLAKEKRAAKVTEISKGSLHNIETSECEEGDRTSSFHVSSDVTRTASDSGTFDRSNLQKDTVTDKSPTKGHCSGTDDRLILKGDASPAENTCDRNPKESETDFVDLGLTVSNSEATINKLNPVVDSEDNNVPETNAFTELNKTCNSS